MTRSFTLEKESKDMFRVGEILRYGQAGVCRVEEIKMMDAGGGEQEYFVLKPLFKNGAMLFVPSSNEGLVGRMCPLLTPEEIEAIQAEISRRPAEWIRDFRSEAFKKALASSDRRDALFLMKCIYAHKRKLRAEGKGIHTTDDYFLKDAEQLIFSEFSMVLEKSVSLVEKEIRSLLGEESSL